MPVNWEMRMNNLKIMEGDWLQRMTANIPVEMTPNIPVEWTVEYIAPDAWNDYMQTIQRLQEAARSAGSSLMEMCAAMKACENVVGATNGVEQDDKEINVKELKIKFDDVIP